MEPVSLAGRLAVGRVGTEVSTGRPQVSILGFFLHLPILPPPQPGWTPTMAAGGVCRTGGVTEPVQTAMSPIGQLCQLWSCRDREDS